MIWKYRLVGMTIPQPFNFSERRNPIKVENDSLRALGGQQPSAQI
jgi:hypothetical protein